MLAMQIVNYPAGVYSNLWLASFGFRPSASWLVGSYPLSVQWWRHGCHRRKSSSGHPLAGQALLNSIHRGTAPRSKRDHHTMCGRPPLLPPSMSNNWLAVMDACLCGVVALPLSGPDLHVLAVCAAAALSAPPVTGEWDMAEEI